VDNNLDHEKDAKVGLLSRIIQLIKLGLMLYGGTKRSTNNAGSLR
jgi:hypothetical protein